MFLSLIEFFYAYIFFLGDANNLLRKSVLPTKVLKTDSTLKLQSNPGGESCPPPQSGLFCDIVFFVQKSFVCYL